MDTTDAGKTISPYRILRYIVAEENCNRKAGMITLLQILRQIKRSSKTS